MKTIALFLVCPLLVCAQEPATPPATPSTPASPTTPATPPAKPIKRAVLKFTPPKDLADVPRNDGDGASRSDVRVPDLLLPLIPKTAAAFTTQAQPTLFAFVSNTTNCEFRVSILEANQARPSFILASTHAIAGIRRIDLADYGITLKPGVDYKWVVAVRPDPKQRSGDLIGSGTIKRIVPDAALAEKIDKAEAADLSSVYAEAGIWYDALAAISDQIAANPKDQDLVAARKALLEQADLKLVEGPSRASAKPKTAGINAPSLNYTAPAGKPKSPPMDGDGPYR